MASWGKSCVVILCAADKFFTRSPVLEDVLLAIADMI